MINCSFCRPGVRSSVPWVEQKHLPLVYCFRLTNSNIFKIETSSQWKSCAHSSLASATNMVSLALCAQSCVSLWGFGSLTVIKKSGCPPEGCDSVEAVDTEQWILYLICTSSSCRSLSSEACEWAVCVLGERLSRGWLNGDVMTVLSSQSDHDDTILDYPFLIILLD